MYYLLINGQRTGPYQAHEVQNMLRQNAIGYETQFWKDGMFAWETVGSQRHLFETPVYQPQQMYQQPPIYQQPHYQQPMYHQPQVNIYNNQPMMHQQLSSKSRVAYILLGLFLGGLGIHNFYAGYAGKGAVQLILNLTLFWTFIVPIAIGIWVIVEVCTVDRDAQGNRFS
jgi:TM2 domain-containing membrane protein YozV